jgi:hypothetical protein
MDPGLNQCKKIKTINVKIVNSKNQYQKQVSKCQIKKINEFCIRKNQQIIKLISELLAQKLPKSVLKLNIKSTVKM